MKQMSTFDFFSIIADSSSDMLLFCPVCGNLLIIGGGGAESPGQHFICQSCPYICPITQRYSQRQMLKRKQVDDVLGGEDAWKNVDATETTCPKCENTRAFYMLLQTRSADEPSDIVFRCCQCTHLWRER
jgi:DNA-directed RNA polymerase III subunit RPC11